MMRNKTTFAFFFAASLLCIGYGAYTGNLAQVEAAGHPVQTAQYDEQYWAVSNCLDDNSAVECFEQYPEWADDPTLLEALRDQETDYTDSGVGCVYDCLE